jgi:hypothetical protein
MEDEAGGEVKRRKRTTMATKKDRKSLALEAAGKMVPNPAIPEGFFSSAEFAHNQSMGIWKARRVLRELVREGKLISIVGSTSTGGRGNYYGLPGAVAKRGE